MNLGKVGVCGAKCHVWDLGGRLEDLWERYYSDCDAVVFVWKIGTDNDGDTKSDDEDYPPVTAEQQLRLLEKVRLSVADDVPFIVFGHYWMVDDDKAGSSPIWPSDTLYSTASLLHHYHNPLMGMFMGSAVTGQGVKSALEWLIPEATRQQRLRARPTGFDEEKF